MKRVVVITTFAGFTPDYSLIHVVADQLRMLRDFGYAPCLVVQENFCDDRLVPKGTTVLKVMPAIHLHDYQPAEAPRPDFEQQVAAIVTQLRTVLGRFDVAITHDIMFLGWYLPHNEAVRRLAGEFPRLKWLHWIHSGPSKAPGDLIYPSTLRFSMPPNSKLVYLNHHDTLRLAETYGTSPENVRIVYNTKDPDSFFQLHPLVQTIIDRYPVLSADVVAVFPFSTPRWSGKNLHKLLWLMAKIKQHGRSVVLVLPNAHCNVDYVRAMVEELLSYAGQKGLERSEICFTSLLGPEWEYAVPNEAIRQLFQLSNLFINPSLYESCSLILLEAAACKNLLVLNENVPAFREFGGDSALYPQFGSVAVPVIYEDEDAYWTEWAQVILEALDQDRALSSFRRTIRRHNLSWVFRNQLEPLLGEP